MSEQPTADAPVKAARRWHRTSAAVMTSFVAALASTGAVGRA